MCNLNEIPNKERNCSGKRQTVSYWVRGGDCETLRYTLKLPCSIVNFAPNNCHKKVIEGASGSFWMKKYVTPIKPMEFKSKEGGTVVSHTCLSCC